MHVIDPDGEMAETDEDDNVGEAIVLYGETPPKFRVTFIPIRFPGTEAVSVDPATLMTGVRAFWPIADDFEARIGLHDVIPHEFGHNLSLGHAPGCGAVLALDENYPHVNGGLGPHPGWDRNWRRYVSTADGFADIMSSCSELDFPSDYHYRKASEYWLGTRSSAGDAVAFSGAASGVGPMSAAGLATSRGGLTVDEAGVELYREPLSVLAFSHGDEGGWAARTPRPIWPAREVAILNAQGETVLSESLPITP